MKDDFWTLAATLAANRDRDGFASDPAATEPLALGTLEERQRSGEAAWGGAVRDAIEIVDVALRAANVRAVRTAEDVETEQMAWAEELRAAGLSTANRCTVLLPADGEGLGSDLVGAVRRLGAGTAVLPAEPLRRVIAEQRQVRAGVLLTTRTLLLALGTTVYSEFPLEPADLGYERIILVGELSDSREADRISEEFEADLGQVLSGPLGAPVGHHIGGGRYAPAADVELRAWDGTRYDGEGELTLTRTSADAMPLINLSTGRVGKIAPDGSFTLSGTTAAGVVQLGHRLVTTEAIARVMQLVPGVGSWQLESARPGREDVATLRVSASRDEHGPIARNAGRELAERLGLSVEVAVSADTTPFANVAMTTA
jgi:hypothetical protein